VTKIYKSSFNKYRNCYLLYTTLARAEEMHLIYNI